jgi:P-type Cu+ transporter
MHPEIVQDGPGDCPLCGMALEPMGIPTGEEGPNPELVDFTRRFRIGAALTLPVFLLAMAPHVGLPLRAWIGEGVAIWAELVLATPVVLWAGLPFLRGWKSLVNRSLNMFTLIAMGVGAAYAFSVVATVAPADFPGRVPRLPGPCRRLLRGGGGDRRAGAAGAAAGTARARAHRRAIRALLDLAAKTARVIRPDGREEEIPLEDVQVGDRLRVRPGDKVPVDGRWSRAVPRWTSRC